MSASWGFCRGSQMGGAPLIARPPANKAPATWRQASSQPSGTAGNPNSKIVQVGSALAYVNNQQINSGLIVSRDGGDTWGTVATPYYLNSDLDVNAGGLLIALGEANAQFPPYNYNTTDLGGSWVDGPYGLNYPHLSSELNCIVHGAGVWVIVFPAQSTNNVAVSTDDGQSWTFATLAHIPVQNRAALIWDAAGAQFMVLATPYLGTSPDGVTWTWYTITNSQVNSMGAIDAYGGLYAMTGGGYVVVADSPAALAAAPAVLVASGVGATINVAVNSAGRVAVMATAGGQVYTSADGGATWVADVMPWPTGSTSNVRGYSYVNLARYNGSSFVCAVSGGGTVPGYPIAIREELC